MYSSSADYHPDTPVDNLNRPETRDKSRTRQAGRAAPAATATAAAPAAPATPAAPAAPPAGPRPLTVDPVTPGAEPARAGPSKDQRTPGRNEPLCPKLIGRISRHQGITRMHAYVATHRPGARHVQGGDAHIQACQEARRHAVAQPPELLAWWASVRPEEATADRLSIILCDLGLHSTAMRVRKLAATIDVDPSPWNRGTTTREQTPP